MLDIEFTTLVVENFKSFKERATLKLNRPGLTYLCGDNIKYPRLGTNGVGKTALWDALIWCLKGKTASGLGNTDVRMRKATDPTCVKLWFMVNGDKHVIERTISPNKLFLDSESASQDKIDRLVPLSTVVLNHTMLFGQGSKHRKLFLDLLPTEKMDLLADVIDLDRWVGYAETANKEAKALSSEISLLKRDLQRDGDMLDQIDVWIELAVKQVKDWDNEHKGQLAKLEDTLDALRKARDAAEREHTAADLKYESAMAEYNALVKRERAVRDKLAALRKSGKACPECGQPVVDAKQVETVERELTTLNNDMDDFRKRADEFNDIVMRTGPKLARLEGELRTLEKSVTSFEANPYLEKLRHHRERRRDVVRKLDDYDEKLTQLERRHDQVSYWASEGFKTIRLYLIDDLLQELKYNTAHIVEQVGITGWSIDYVVERETKSGSISQGLSVLVSPPHEPPVKWETFSGGEGQRLRLAAALALAYTLLNRAGVRLNLLVLDEPTQRLSSVGIDDLCSTLAAYAKDTDTSVWFIDHHSVDSPHFSSTICVVRDESGSWIET